MDKTIQVCIRCSTSLAIGLKLHFCPYCGTAQLEKKLLEQKTTQNFNPDNPNYKPWREKPLLPKRNYKTLPSKKPKPWCPPMRQLRVRPEKTKSSKHCNGNIAIPIVETFGDVIDGSIGGSAACNNDDVVATDAPAYEEDISPPDIQSEPYIGFYTQSTNAIAIYDAEQWMAIGGMAVNISLVQQTLGNCIHGYWLRVGVIFDDNMPTKGEVEERAPGEATLFQESNGGSPLHNPDNELNFISVREIEEYTQAESLGQQLVGGLEAPAGVAPTLEAAAEAAEGSTAFEERSNEEDLYVIAMLSSDAAKFMIPQVEDWVDLCAIDPTEYYMARHMEKVMQSVAHRVATSNLSELAHRQNYCVEMRRRTKQSKLSSTLAAVNGAIPAAVLERMTVRTASVAWNYNANQVVCKELDDGISATSSSPSKKGGLMSRTRTSISVSFLDWLVQLSHKLVLTRGISVRFVPAMVRFSVRYDNRLTDPQEFQNSFQHPQRDNDAAGSPTAAAAAAAASQKYTFSRAASAPSFSTDSTAAEEIEEAATGRYVDPRVDERNRKLKRFAESQCVTHVVLSVTPVATSAEEVIPPAVLSFDLESMSVLLKDAAPSSVDEFLADAKKASLAQLAKRLASLVRLEYTNSGIKYAVVGVFSEPAHISCGWPVDQVNLNDDDSDIDDDLGPPLSPSILEEEPGRSPEAAVEICSASPSPSPPPPPPGMEEEPKDPQEEVAAEVLIVSVSSDEPPAEEPPPQCSDPPMLCGYCTCPLHPELSASTPCACLRREVTIKGSSLWVYGDFQPPLDSAMDLQAAALLAESSSLCDVYALLRKGVSVQCANSLTVLAVDQADESLSCEVSVTAAQLCCLLQRAALASSLSRAADVKNLSKHNQQQVPVDLRNHPALVDELFSVICSEAHMDLFLSRKSRVMKLSVK